MTDRGGVFHFSEDGNIRRFAPHVPATNPSHPPAVWAIGAARAPLYWFPRDCPRISVWADTAEQQRVLTDTFDTEASVVLAAETGWLPRIRNARLYRYAFDAADFEPWPEAEGQFVAYAVVTPIEVEPIDDLLAEHARAEVDLRFTPRLGPLTDRMLASGLPFSFVRLRNALR